MKRTYDKNTQKTLNLYGKKLKSYLCKRLHLKIEELKQVYRNQNEKEKQLKSNQGLDTY